MKKVNLSKLKEGAVLYSHKSGFYYRFIGISGVSGSPLGKELIAEFLDPLGKKIEYTQSEINERKWEQVQ